jgi:cobaltochelatase CobT
MSDACAPITGTEGTGRAGEVGVTNAAGIRREQRIRELRAASIRALSGRRGIQFRGPDLYDGRRRMTIPAPHLNPPSERGAADGIALRLRYTDPELHRELLPDRPASRLVFEMLEQFRVESLAPPCWGGVRRNVTERFRQWAGEFEASRSAETASGLLLYTVAQVCRSRITADPIGEVTQDLIEQTRFDLTARLGIDLGALRRNRYSQRDFGEIARAVAEAVADLPPLQAEPGESAPRPDAFGWQIDLDCDDAGDDSGTATSGLGRRLSGSGGGYRVFTRAYDETRSVAALVRPDLLREFRQRVDTLAAGTGVSPRMLGRQLAQLLAEPRIDGWEGGHQTGYIDGRRLAQLVATPNERSIFLSQRHTLRPDSIVTFLVDCSGSMKAFSESLVTLLDVFARALDLAGISCEILGFTTAAWNGGRARRDWIRAGRPPVPGRLNEVRQLVVKSADTSWRSARMAIAGLLKLDLYREGVDGEAVEWACTRLATRAEHRRILVVISDGSPMDAATCLANGEHYLDHHLRDVLARDRDVDICAIGVGLDLSAYYNHCTATDLTEGVNRRVVSDVLATIASAATRR